MAEDEDDINYDEPEEIYSDPDDDNNKKQGENYEILSPEVLDKERNQKIEEFIQISDLPKSQAELVLMNNN
jgi:hypothetical protein